jgi:hypothetical protein
MSFPLSLKSVALGAILAITASAGLIKKAESVPTHVCSTQTISKGDDWTHLASRCGITPERLQILNPLTNPTKLLLDHWVCCSEGTLPDHSYMTDPTGTCKTQTVSKGDTCEKLAGRCGLESTQQFRAFNPYITEQCSNLSVGQLVCCNPGKLPQISIEANLDGTCRPTTVAPGETCEALAKKCGLASLDQLLGLKQPNLKCESLAAGQQVCCSKGNLYPSPGSAPNSHNAPPPDPAAGSHNAPSPDSASNSHNSPDQGDRPNKNYKGQTCEQ